MAGDIRLRDVEDGDLDTLYEYQHEPESSAMAAVPSREREAFMAHEQGFAPTRATSIRLSF